jgi:energy-coupling factor transporter ATP-binding protein EcfA2
VLHQSLWNDARLALRFTHRPDAVQRPYSLRLPAEGGDAPLPAGTTIQDVYDAQHGALLVLGQPGSGKTTLLLELTKILLDRADGDASHPVPVVFNMATWQERQTLADWLVVQLNREYSVPKKIGQVWVTTGALLLLLDGLDEVAEARRANCVAAINTYRAEHEAAWATPMVVCCRVQEYRTLPPLQLHGAILVQPLTKAEVDTYLSDGGQTLAGVRAVVEDDPTLYELLETPLLLAVTTLAFAGQQAAELRQTALPEERRRAIFAAFIDRSFSFPSRGEVKARYSQKRTLFWLANLGQRMKKENNSIYWIESMQKSWLLDLRLAKILYTTICLLLGVVFGILGGFLGGWIILLFMQLLFDITNSLDIQGRIAGQQSTPIVFISLVFGIRMALAQIRPITITKWGFTGISHVPNGKLIFYLFLYFILFISMRIPISIFVYIFLCIIALVLNKFRVLYIADEPNKPNEFIYKPTVKSFVYMTASFPIGFVVFYYFEAAIISYIIIYGGIFFGLLFGGFVAVKHYTLRLLLALSGTFPWNIAAFLDSCAQRRLVQRVGGGWRFPHNLIRDYFAELESREEGRD